MATITTKDDPRAYWNDEAGPRWVRSQAPLDRIMAPVTASIFDVANLARGMRVLDIGCGSGSLTLDAVGRVGPSGTVTGVDVSAPLLQHARARAKSCGAKASFLLADAQDHRFSDADADRVLSRFGVMFFRDSEAAFGNLRRALNANGRLVFACWQSPEVNPWITWPLAALGDLATANSAPAPKDSDSPGPFRFADPDRLRTLLRRAGFAQVRVHDRQQDLNLGGDSQEILNLVQDVGPLSRVLASLEPDLRQEGLNRVLDYVRKNHEGHSMALAGGWWVVDAAP